MILLADRLRGLRGTESQTAFAARFGLKQAIYSHYETGRKKPSLEVLVEMAKTLGATTDYLLGLSDDPPPLRASLSAVASAKADAPETSIKVRDIKNNSAPVIVGSNNTVVAPPPSSSSSKKKGPRK